MLQDYIYEYIHSYIDNEIEYIKQDLQVSGLGKDLLRDLNYLENMSENEKMEIAEKVIEDNELGNKINELIHYYLYH